MSEKELEWKVQQLAELLEAREKQHAQTIDNLKSEAKSLKKKLSTIQDRRTAVRRQEKPKPDDTFTRGVQWTVDNFRSRYDSVRTNEAIWSPEFSVMGVSGLQLEFFPKGRDTTSHEGFCALFLWCPASVKIKYQLRVGNHWCSPDEDEYTSRMGHGHSNFCYLEAHVDTEKDCVLVGLNILHFSIVEDFGDGLRVWKISPESLCQQAAGYLHHRDMDTVEWKIKDIRKRAKEVPRSLPICSPTFSIAGVPEMLLEFYPNGLQTQSDGSKEDHCGLYVRCPVAASLRITLFVGAARKGPIKTEFDGLAAKGLPEFCTLESQLVEDEPDLTVGIQVRNPKLEEEEQKQVLQL